MIMKLKKVIAIFLAAAASLTLASCNKGDGKETDPAETTVQTDSALYDASVTAMRTGNLTVTKGELTYIAYYNYQQFCGNYAPYLSYYGLDTTKPLKNQKCTLFDGHDTWYDYFMDNTLSYAAQTLSACEAAMAARYSLSDEEKSEIDKALAGWQKTAQEAGCANADEYIKSKIGRDFTLADVRSYTEKSYLSSKYFSDVLDSYVITEDEINALYASDENAFKYIDFLAYTFYAENGAEGEASAHAAALAQCTTEKEFTDYIKTYLSDVILSSIRDEEKPERIKSVMDTVINKRVLRGSAAFYDWAFSQTGDGMTDEESSGLIYSSNNEESGSYTVYLLTRAPYRVDTPVRTYRDIKLTKATCDTYSGAVAKATELLSAFDGTEDSFAALAREWSEDADSRSSGGIVKNTAIGETTPAEIDSWLFGENRTPGDTEIIKSDGECHLVYYVSKGLPKWQNDAREKLRYERYTKDVDAFAETYPVTRSADVITDVEI